MSAKRWRASSVSRATTWSPSTTVPQRWKRSTNTRPDAIVLDVMMPLVDGFSVCRRLRARNDHTPVLMLTARDEVHDRVVGLDAGADDYLPKPFALDELLARMRALLRRADMDIGGPLVFDDLGARRRTPRGATR